MRSDLHRPAPAHPAVPRGLLARLVAFALTAAVCHPAAADDFATTGDMVQARNKGAASTLADGRVLITGGRTTPVARTLRAEIYDPATGLFTETGNTISGRQDHRSVLLADGRVLILGGGNLLAPATGDPATPAEIYDPATGEFSAISPMLGERDLFAAERLANGKVLIVGGRGCAPCLDLGGGVLTTRNVAIAELFDPVTQTFSPAGPLASRGTTTITPLADGRALIIGGQHEELEGDRDPVFVYTPLTSAEIYDPATNTFSPVTATMSHARYGHVAALLPDGRVLVATGTHDTDGFETAEPVEIYDPLTDTFSLASEPALAPRLLYNQAATLSNGDVLLAGGDAATAGNAQVFSAALGDLKPAPLIMLRPHVMHIVAPLPNGRALVAGGVNPTMPGPLPRPQSQVYRPDALFGDGLESPPIPGEDIPDEGDVAAGANKSAAQPAATCSFALPQLQQRGKAATAERSFVQTRTGEVCVVADMAAAPF